MIVYEKRMKRSMLSAARGRPINLVARTEKMHQILDGARACFVERGFHSSSVAQISAAAQVSTANMYQYFPNKDALVIALIERDIERQLDMIGNLTERDLTFETIKAAFSDLFTTREGYEVAVMRAEITSEGGRNPRVAEMLRKAEITLCTSLVRGIRSKHRTSVSRDLENEPDVDRISLVFEGIMRLYVFSPHDGDRLLDQLCAHLSKTFATESR